MAGTKYVNLGFICRRCKRFLSIPTLFPDGQYPPGHDFEVRCPLCGAVGIYTPADVVLRYSSRRPGAAPTC